jgi:hypothetical protein
MAVSTAVATRNAMLDVPGAALNTGYLRIYSGTPPATADTSLSGNTLLAELRLNSDAFPAASSGVLTANAITADSTADATGTATFFRLFDSDGTTVRFQGAVATSGAELNMSSVSIVASAVVEVTSLTITLP